MFTQAAQGGQVGQQKLMAQMGELNEQKQLIGIEYNEDPRQESQHAPRGEAGDPGPVTGMDGLSLFTKQSDIVKPAGSITLSVKSHRS